MMLLAFLAAAAQPQESAKAYMERLYASYDQPSFNPLDHPARYFAPRLLRAISEDERLAHHEVGYLDGDPICQCQDPGGLHAAIVRVDQKGPDAATVRVSLGFPGDKPRVATFTLVRLAAGWRIADVSSADDPSLVSSLEASNWAARRHRH